MIAVGFLCFSASSYVLAFEKEEEGENDKTDLLAFSELTKNINHLFRHEKIPYQFQGFSPRATVVAEPQLPLSNLAAKKSTKDILPSLSTDSTKINPVDLAAFGISNLAGSGGSASPKGGLLPIPQARMVSPVGEQLTKEALDAPLKTEASQKNQDVLVGLTPKSTRFGSDRYDETVFQSLNNSKNSSINGVPGVSGSASTKNQYPAPVPINFSDDEKEKQKNKEQEARESFQQTMKEFAERTEEKEAFRLVDYYDLKNVLSKNESILSSFENDEFDERFIRNAQTIFERFADKDSALDKKPFEKFLKRVQPEPVMFQSSDPRKGQVPSGRTDQTHRQQNSK